MCSLASPRIGRLENIRASERVNNGFSGLGHCVLVSQQDQFREPHLLHFFFFFFLFHVIFLLLLLLLLLRLFLLLSLSLSLSISLSSLSSLLASEVNQCA